MVFICDDCLKEEFIKLGDTDLCSSYCYSCGELKMCRFVSYKRS